MSKHAFPAHAGAGVFTEEGDWFALASAGAVRGHKGVNTAGGENNETRGAEMAGDQCGYDGILNPREFGCAGGAEFLAG